MIDVDSQLIADRYATFQQLAGVAEEHLAHGRYAVAAVYAQIAAKYAAGQHPGLFASDRLEYLLYSIGRNVADQALPTEYLVDRVHQPERVLHVFTRVAGIGGHTRMAWRWIASDSDRIHSIAITRQGFLEVPEQLSRVVEQSLGSVHIIDRKPGDLIALAKRLRVVAQSCDLVVLHIDPDDVVPIIALAGHSLSAPVVFVNHADQLFWLGVSVSDVVANLRHSGQMLATSRRGVPLDRCALVPIPIVAEERSLSRIDAKREIGLPDDSVMLLSVARPHKYASVNGVSFIDALMPIVERFPKVHVLVVGPGEDEAWARANRMTGGRLRTVGLRWDTSLYYQAADIYVDSYPVVSITSMLEAGSLGLPLVSRHPDGEGNTVLSADTPALERHVLGAKSSEELREHLAWLIESEESRHELGDLIRRDIEAVHSGTGWKQALRDLYRVIHTVSPIDAPRNLPDKFWTDKVDILLPRMFPREPDLDLVMQFNLRLFPFLLRTRLWSQLLMSSRVFRPGLLLSQSTATRLEKWQFSRSNTRRPRAKSFIPTVGKVGERQ